MLAISILDHRIIQAVAMGWAECRVGVQVRAWSKGFPHEPPVGLRMQCRSSRLANFYSIRNSRCGACRCRASYDQNTEGVWAPSSPRKGKDLPQSVCPKVAEVSEGRLDTPMREPCWASK